MIDKVLETINRHNLVNSGEGVVVGVSGGPDSVCLLHVLYTLREKLNIKLYAVHINHMLRGKESEGDEKYVKELCEKLGIPAYFFSVDVKDIASRKGISLEEAGREARYGTFEKVAGDVGASKVAVAHNKNDQAETILLNIIRGSGLDGLKGMEYKRGNIIRPLLDVRREEIEEYCRQHSLNPRIDSTNLLSIYTRNKIRLDLIPSINNMFDIDIQDNLSRMSALLRDDLDYIEENAVHLYNKCLIDENKDSITINAAIFQKYHIAIRRRIVRSIIKKLTGSLKGIESVHVEQVLQLCENGRTGAEIHLPGRLKALKSYDHLIICTVTDSAAVQPFCRSIKIPGVTLVPEIGAGIKAVLEKKSSGVEQYVNMRYNSMEQYFDYDKLIMGINIRNRRDGDVFKPYKSNGTKKLKEYFIDNKIPRHERDSIPLITQGKEIVWVIGYKISDKFKVTENTKTVLKLIYFLHN